VSAPIVVLGAGVAGHSAICWLRDWHVPALWLDDQPAPGGLLRRLHNPLHNTPGARYADGPAMVAALDAERAALHIAAPHITTIHAIQRAEDETLRLIAADEAMIPASAIILATGTRYRRLGVPGEQEGLASGLVRQSASGGASAVAGQRVAIVGAGDAAYEGALILAEHGCQVHLLTRGQVRAQPHFVQRVAAHAAITRHAQTQLAAISPGPLGATLRLVGGGVLEVASVFVRIGVEPQHPALWAEPVRDAQGYLVVDRAQRTSLPGLLAAGDVTDNPLKSVVSAAGDGARAAWTCRALLAGA
jgi:thioredoxin reductase (NADPH)